MEEETLEHVWEVCTRWGREEGLGREKGWQEMKGEILGEGGEGEGGEGEEWMKKLERWRGESGIRREWSGGSGGPVCVEMDVGVCVSRLLSFSGVIEWLV